MPDTSRTACLVGEPHTHRDWLQRCPWLRPVATQQDDWALYPLTEPERLELRHHSRPAWRLSLDFTRGRQAYRLRQAQHQNEAVVRAMGKPETTRPLQVIDATAGLGRDSLILAASGMQVTALEAHPCLAALLLDAWTRLQVQAPELCARLQFHFADSTDWLPRQGQQADVIYLDPMYPPRRKQASVKQDMQILHALLGSQAEDSPQARLRLLLQARRHARRRVVVKGPAHAEALDKKNCSGHILSGQIRFDIYPALPDSAA